MANPIKANEKYRTGNLGGTIGLNAHFLYFVFFQKKEGIKIAAKQRVDKKKGPTYIAEPILKCKIGIEIAARKRKVGFLKGKNIQKAIKNSNTKLP